jgi:pyruvate-formate lyase-activating enzyme
MKRILCLGNNTEDTDTQTKKLSADNQSVCYGLLSDLDGTVTAESFGAPGYYHSSVYDIEFGRLVEICNQFDEILILDQAMKQWSHPDAFYKTLEISTKVSVPVIFANPNSSQGFNFFSNLVQTNRSFCILPFVAMHVNYGSALLCCKSAKPIAKVSDLEELPNFQSSEIYTNIRSKMINGELLSDYCNGCYKLEKQGITSGRQFETVEWANRLNINNLNDLDKIDSPVYYEIFPSNKCNLQCRMCGPHDSHLIEKEYKSIGLLNQTEISNKKLVGFEIVNLDSVKKIYVAGGEPTIMPEFYEFLDRCIAKDRTDIEFLVNTNGTKLSEKLKSQLIHFSNFHFIFSIDAFKDLNYYIRWPSEWDCIIDNLHYLKKQKHSVTINTTVSIYNIAKLHELFAFVDYEFPNTVIHCQIAENLSPFLYPNPHQALDSLAMIQSMNCYKNSPLLASSIDGYIRQFKQNLDSDIQVDLHKFFEFNDLLDQSRNVYLQDYLPELEQHRGTICP